MGFTKTIEGIYYLSKIYYASSVIPII